MKFSKRTLKAAFEIHVIHGMCILIEVFNYLKMSDLAIEQEKIKEDFLLRMEKLKK